MTELETKLAEALRRLLSYHPGKKWLDLEANCQGLKSRTYVHSTVLTDVRAGHNALEAYEAAKASECLDPTSAFRVPGCTCGECK